MLDKAGRTGARVAWYNTGVDDNSVGTALALIPFKRWIRWLPVLSERGDHVSPFRSVLLLLGAEYGQAKSSQSSEGGDLREAHVESLCLLTIPAFDGIAGLCNRHLTVTKEYANAKDFKSG